MSTEKNQADLVINISPELEKAKRLLSGISDLSEYSTDENTAMLVQNNCHQAKKNIQNIIDLLKLNQKP